MVTDLQSPTLCLLHENVLTNVDIKLSRVDFVLNLIALRNMIHFAEKFEENIQQITLLSPKPAKKRVKKNHEENKQQVSTDTLSSQEVTEKKAKNKLVLSTEQIKDLLSRKTNETSKTKITIPNL